MTQNINQITPKAIIFNTSFRKTNISKLIQQVRIIKDIERPVHRMTVTLNSSMSGNLKTSITHNKILAHLKSQININSIISLKVDSRSKKHSFLGFIDHIFESTTSSNNTTNRVLVLNCSLLLPKLLLKDNIINSPVLSSHSKIREELGDRVKFFKWSRGMTKDGKSPFSGKPEEAVKWILENVPATNTNVGNELFAKSFFDPKKKDLDGKSLLDFKFLNGEFLFSQNLSRYSGPILNYIYQCIDRQFYEVFFDTTTCEDGLAYNKMIIRTKPFSFLNYKEGIENSIVSNWSFFDDLKTTEISSEERIFENLGINDYELKNFFTVNFAHSMVGSSSSYLGKFGLQFPIINIDSIKRYGLRDIQMTSFLKNDLTNESKNLQYLLSKREKAVEWFAYPYYESGQLTIIARDDITIGQILNYKDKLYYDVDNGKTFQGVQYYISGITENFTFGDTHTQTLRLTRGAPKGLAVNWLNENRPSFISTGEIKEDGANGIESINKPIGIDNLFDLERTEWLA